MPPPPSSYGPAMRLQVYKLTDRRTNEKGQRKSQTDRHVDKQKTDRQMDRITNKKIKDCDIFGHSNVQNDTFAGV